MASASVGAVDPPRRRWSQRRREALTGYRFISPWILGFLVFTLGAMVFSLVISFSHYQLITNTARPAGLDNYQALLADPKVMMSLGNTLFYAILAVPFEICLALLLALLLNSVRRGAGVFRTLYYLPKMTPTVATASIFLLLLNGNQGAVNRGLAAIGIQGVPWWCPSSSRAGGAGAGAEADTIPLGHLYPGCLGTRWEKRCSGAGGDGRSPAPVRGRGFRCPGTVGGDGGI